MNDVLFTLYSIVDIKNFIRGLISEVTMTADKVFLRDTTMRPLAKALRFSTLLIIKKKLKLIINAF